MTVLPRLCICWGLLLLVGCGSSSAPLASVQGQVRYRGQPVAGGTIVFSPDSTCGCRGPLACARLDEEGRYRLLSDGKQGAVPGWHRVTIAGTAERSLPDHFLDPELSGHRFEVRPDGPNVCNLILE